MTLDESLFASAELHEREVEVAPGKPVKLHFRELPAVDFIRFHAITTSGDEDARAGAAARLIAAGVCNPDGSAAMTFEKALKLKSAPLTAIFNALLEVNNADAGKP